MRNVLVALLSFLLLGMQHETLVHAFQHDAARLAASEKSLTRTTAEGPCITCALNAGASHALVAIAVFAAPAAPAFTPATSSYRSRFSRAPVYYASRAPPVPA